MISSEAATAILSENCLHFGTESIALENALNEILSENLIADSDLPPFHRVMMDGIAIRHQDLAIHKTFKIVGTIRAGEESERPLNAGEAFEIMTGAVLPPSACAVIPYEKLKIENEVASLEHTEFKMLQNIHVKGTDFKKGDLLVSKYTVLQSAQLGVAASIGKAQIQIQRKPSILFVSTGDELVEVSQQPLAFQIRKSNDLAIKGLLKPFISNFKSIHIKDDEPSLFAALKENKDLFDIIIFSGGVSKGKYDFVPRIIEKNNYQLLFHRIAQKPGKPFLCARKADKFIFGLPGNPVSSMIGCARYIIPWLKQSLNVEHGFPRIFLGEDFSNTSSLTLFIPVELELNNGLLEMRKVFVNGSGDFASMDRVSGWLELAENTEMKKGSIGKYIPLKPFNIK